MRMYMIGACVLGSFAGSVSAQSSISIYGRLDASFSHISNVSSITALTEGAGATSNFGFRGVEDLGGGLSAIFDLESKVAIDTGSGGAASNSGTNRSGPIGLFSRNAYVGLKGGFGTITAGRNYTPTILAMYNMNAIPVGINTGMGGNVAPQGIGNDFWNNNQIKYDSPGFGGFSFMVNYVPGESSGNSTKGTNYGASVAYRSSGVVLTAGHQKDNDHVSDNSLDWTVITASYTVGKFKIAGGYDRVKNPSKIAGWVDSELWSVGGAYKITPALTLAGQYFRNHEENTGTASKQLVVNAEYKLSKRTGLYATATRTENGALAIMPIYGSTGIVNTNATAMALGIQHTF